jgi:hypothetical protein
LDWKNIKVGPEEMWSWTIRIVELVWKRSGIGLEEWQCWIAIGLEEWRRGTRRTVEVDLKRSGVGKWWKWTGRIWCWTGREVELDWKNSRGGLED